MAGLNQLLSVFADGRVVLDDRKARARSEVHATPSELETLLTLIDAVPAGRWHSSLGALGRALLPRPHEGMRFAIRSPAGRLGGSVGRADADLVELLAELDQLLARAVREGRA